MLLQIVLIIHQTLTRNAGAAGVILSLATEYRKLGHDVTIISHDDLKLRGRFRRILFPIFCAALISRRHRRADVIDAASGTGWLYFTLPHFKRRTLFVSHSHGLAQVFHDVLMANVRAGLATVSWKYPLYNGSVALFLDAISFRAADLSLFLNRSDTNYAVERIRVNPQRVETVSNGLSDQFLQKAAALTIDPRERRDRIVQVGAYTARKGVKTTAQAMHVVLERCPAAAITFLGTGSTYERVANDYQTSNRGNLHVRSTYDNRELPSLLAEHDILLLPSLSEGFGIAALEAMACGLVPIVTDIPGPTEFITHRNNGLVVPVGDAHTLARAIVELIEDSELYERLRSRARETAFALRWTTIAAARVELYRKYIARRKRR